ncbi:extracellular solute-binding protein [bacterium]|nr:extracellular solute-binding protein [bacterium]
MLLWHSWAGADGEALSLMLGAFQAANPDVQLETLFVAYNELPQAYADAVYAEGGPDLILAPTWWLQQLADAETLQPLDGLVGEETLSAYLPATVTNLRYQQQLYGLPISLDLVSLYYNRNLVDEAALPTTTEEMLALAQANPRQGAGLYANFYHLFWGVPAYGGALFDDTGRAILEQSDGAAAFLAWLSAMSNTPGVFVDLDYGMLIDRFKKGEFAFFVDGPWSSAELEAALGDALGVALLPAGPAGAAQPWLNAEGVMLNPVYSPAQQQLALRLALHLAGPESGAILAQTAQRVPAQIGAPIEDPILAGFTAQAQNAVSLTNQPELDAMWGYTGDMLLKVLNDVLSPEEAVLEASTLINEANDK